MATSLTSTGVTFPDSTVQTTAATSAGGTLEAVASGSLSDGSTVIVNSDGTVSVVGLAAIDPPTIGSQSQVATNASTSNSCVYDKANNKIIIFYRNNSNYGTAIVGSLSGASISFGTPVVFNSASSNSFSSVYDEANNKIIIVYRDSGNSDFGTSMVGTVSGTTISFGSEYVFESANSSNTSITYDSNNEKIVISYLDQGNSGYGTAIVGTVSGTSISFGTPVVFDSISLNGTSISYDLLNQKIVIAYYSDPCYAIVGTVSGTSISFGTRTTVDTDDCTYVTVVYDSKNEKSIITYRDRGSNTYYGTAIVGTVSGTSISFGTPVVFELANSIYISSCYASASGSLVIAYNDVGNSFFGTLIVGTLSGTSISFGTPIVFSGTNRADYINIVYSETDKKNVIVFVDSTTTNSTYGIVANIESTNLTSENFIGISDGAYTNGQTATVLIAGSVSEAQTGLTAGQAYYVQSDGTISTTPGTPSVFAGTAIAATKLLVQG